ncbi:hypothetical protein [Streptomyces mashuensis]|uniref:hypothetical protein n=1 Tax=Streptomyces mashuensis TaxID=33904 RepID=UPI00167EF8BB|nr:hypothetical protein [Streptomyces mashuensis]
MSGRPGRGTATVPPGPDAMGRTARPDRRTESGTPPEAAEGHSPDGWEANHAVLAHLAEHRVRWAP